MSTSAIGTGLSGLNTYLQAISVTANNVANANTSGFQPQQALFQENSPAGSGVHLSDAVSANSSTLTSAPSGTDVAAEMVNLLMYKIGFQASAKVVTTSDQQLGRLIDTKG